MPPRVLPSWYSPCCIASFKTEFPPGPSFRQDRVSAHIATVLCSTSLPHLGLRPALTRFGSTLSISGAAIVGSVPPITADNAPTPAAD